MARMAVASQTDDSSHFTDVLQDPLRMGGHCGTITHKQSSNARIEDSLAYNVTHSSRDYHRNAFFQRTVREWNILPESAV